MRSQGNNNTALCIAFPPMGRQGSAVSLGRPLPGHCNLKPVSMLHRRHQRQLNSATVSEPNTCGPACRCLNLRGTRIPRCGEAICSTILLYITRPSASSRASALCFLLVDTQSVAFWSSPRHPLHTQQVAISNFTLHRETWRTKGRRTLIMNLPMRCRP